METAPFLAREDRRDGVELAPPPLDHSLGFRGPWAEAHGSTLKRAPHQPRCVARALACRRELQFAFRTGYENPENALAPLGQGVVHGVPVEAIRWVTRSTKWMIRHVFGASTST